MRKKIYLACALTHAPKEFVDSIMELKGKLSERYDILEFLGTQAEPSGIYVRDIKECVAQADAIVAMCDYPSLGLGYEMATKLEKLNGRVLALAHESSKVSKLILGIGASGFKFSRYGTVGDVVRAVDAFMEGGFSVPDRVTDNISEMCRKYDCIVCVARGDGGARYVLEDGNDEDSFFKERSGGAVTVFLTEDGELVHESNGVRYIMSITK